MRDSRSPVLRYADPRSTGRIAGFTLIEMVVTIGIIIIAAGFLIPSMAKLFQNRKLENAGTLISSTMNEARNNAVTKKQTYQVVFLRDGLRLYREPKGKDLGAFEGSIRPYDPDTSGTLSYDLHFARRDFKSLPTDLAVILDDATLPAKEWQTTPQDIVLRFLPDGTVDFGSYQDIPTYEFNETPPEDSDIVLSRLGDLFNRGYIDIRPTGRTVFKIEVIE